MKIQLMKSAPILFKGDYNFDLKIQLRDLPYIKGHVVY